MVEREPEDLEQRVKFKGVKPEDSCIRITRSKSVALPNIQSGQMSVEQRAFRRCHQVFHDGVDPSSLVPVLYSKSLLTPEEREKAIHSTATDRERIQAILTALERRISIEPTPFNVMLAALESEPALNAVGHRIKAIYDEECGKGTMQQRPLPHAQQPLRQRNCCRCL
ncbi:hypothetical protein GBAR_LOCUS18777 [Geodia barretti]|uniref:Uncharacterized protein n=1 Tax=Geodia barretti TaxID=519541 RepID=A0AA35WTJ5_GEOBA|nr:hypothetical protein GBAR_LOCUS18777 [Geodia barretti]